MKLNNVLTMTGREIEQKSDQELLEAARTAIQEQRKIYDTVNFGEPTATDKTMANKLQMKEGELRTELAGRGYILNNAGDVQSGKSGMGGGHVA